MSSGVTVNKSCVLEYENLKMKHQYGYIIFKISDDRTQIQVDILGDKGASYDEFKEKLMEAGKQGNGRYGVFDVEVNKNKNVIAFLTWLPDNHLNIKQKMLYTASKKAIREKLVGIGADLQCNDEDDLCFSNISEKCQSRYT